MCVRPLVLLPVIMRLSRSVTREDVDTLKDDWLTDNACHIESPLKDTILIYHSRSYLFGKST